MMRRTLSALALALALAAAAMPVQALAAEDKAVVVDYSFPHEGPFGTFDRLQLQRGFQIFAQVCTNCHGLQFVPIRTLGNADGPAFPPEQVKAFAAQYQCADPDLPPGETRACKPSDNFPPNTGAGAPDLSLITKQRAGFHGPMGLGINQLLRGSGGPEYVASLMMGYTGEEEEVAGSVLYRNTAIYGGLTSMLPPLFEGAVEYSLVNADGTPLGEDGEAHGADVPEPTMEQMAKDVAAFLTWTAEPTMVERKQAGFRNILLLIILAVLLYYTNKKLWAPIKRKDG